MKFVPFVYDSELNRINVDIARMSQADADVTDSFPMWQTSWNSDFLNDGRFENYSMKAGDELIALGAYEILQNQLVVHIAYLESQPQSNPVITEKKKYTGIGRVLIAFGIKLSIDAGFNGDVVLEAKTSELERHYVRDFGAVKLPSFGSSAPRLLIADEAAKNIFYSYLE